MSRRILTNSNTKTAAARRQDPKKRVTHEGNPLRRGSGPAGWNACGHGATRPQSDRRDNQHGLLSAPRHTERTPVRVPSPGLRRISDWKEDCNTDAAPGTCARSRNRVTMDTSDEKAGEKHGAALHDLRGADPPGDAAGGKAVRGLHRREAGL